MMNRRHLLNSALGALAHGFAPLPAAAQGNHRATGYIRTNWSRDPFSWGSYSYVAKGAKKRDHATLGLPVGERLFFAGEAAHPIYNSTVHAAYETGARAAEAILAANAASVGIVGAGISGLAAARALRQKGVTVTIFEARDRIGGRVWTDQSLGAPLDLGASWIHGTNGNPLDRLARDLNIATQPTSDSYVLRGGDGRQMRDGEAPLWLENVVSVQHSAGADLKEINASAYLRDHDYDGDEVIFPQGYGQLADALAAGADIRLGHVIREVDTSGPMARLTDQTGQTEVFDAVLVTVPLGVLKRGALRFTPDLPEDKRAAISNLGMGLLDKLYLRFDDVFWDAEATWIITPENGLPQGQFNQWLNLFPYLGQPILLAFNGAQPARDLAAASDHEIVDKALRTLDLAYP